jgi:tight adherence protein B
MNLQAFYPYAIYVFTAAAAIFLAEAFYLAASSVVGRKRSINRRLQALSDGMTGEQVLIELRRERGINPDGSVGYGGRFSRLLVQSGLRLSQGKFALIMIAAIATLFAVMNFYLRTGLLISVPLAVVGGLAIPILALQVARARRQSLFISQLPDALDVIVRSIRSGHPVPVAMSMVGREMPDPVGSEFGITVDEMTYGLDTEKALLNMYGRVGHPELGLLVTAVSLQTVTGGNLSEVLENLAKIIRERFQLRRKVKALSAEGRISAYALSAIPILLALYINMVNPSYYGSVLHEPIFIPAMVAIFIWSLVGDFIMYKMINFKY